MPGQFKNLVGTIYTKLQIGIGGVFVKSNAGTLEARNAADSAYAPVQASQVKIADANGQAATLAVPDLAADYTLVFPPDDGSPAQVLTTDGNGNLTWTTVAGGVDKPVADTTTLSFNSAATLAMFALPANAVVRLISVIVDTAFNGTPSASVGIAGSTAKYLGATDIDLKASAETVFEIVPGKPASGAAENLIITYAAGGATVGSARFIVEFVIPS